MKFFLLVLSLSFMMSCGKTWRSKQDKQDTPTKPTPATLDQWSGRSDYIDTRWQVKNPP
ncbi:MAG: hypothetical protein M3Q07_13190 [Pseudobdellovibrionaceae bacterium]|nr:hypothetical protein [Pseudobdellovibrionaceae bacterium]